MFGSAQNLIWAESWWQDDWVSNVVVFAGVSVSRLTVRLEDLCGCQQIVSGLS